MTAPPTVGIDGFVDDRFALVAEVFAANLRTRGDSGAAVCIYHEGRVVVDLAAHGVPRTALQVVRSATKGVVAILAHLLAQRGDLDLDEPVSHWWPEFAAEGKRDIPVRWLLTHQAGLPAVERTLTLAQALAWNPPVEALATQRPLWEPGTAHGYHDLTFGWLVGEVLRRATGQTVGQLVAMELATPLGLDLWIGLPAPELPRVIPLVPAPPTPGPLDERAAALRAALADPGSLPYRVVLNPNVLPAEHTLEYLSAEVPSANGVSNARSLARLYAATVSAVDGRRLLGDAVVRSACTPQAEGIDLVVGYERRYGTGFMLPEPTRPMGGIGTRCFGHYGQGGTLAFADPRSTIGFAYTSLQDQFHASADPRSRLLAQAAVACARQVACPISAPD